MKFPEPFSTRLKNLRLKVGLSQLELEALCAFPRGALARIELGRRPASERQCTLLAQALRVSEQALVAGTDLLVAPVTPPSWLKSFPGNAPAWIRPEWTLESRFSTMQSCYPWQCREALALLRKNPLCDQIAILFRDFWVDSNLEGIYWLRVAGHASPHWLSLESSNFRVHPVVCPRTGRLRGDLPHPCLVTEIPFRACWFPQVTLLLKGFVKHRPDCLVHLGGSDWAVVQIDGGGHKDRLDALKDKELGLPVLRLSSADVFSTRLLEKLKTLVSR